MRHLFIILVFLGLVLSMGVNAKDKLTENRKTVNSNENRSSTATKTYKTSVYFDEYFYLSPGGFSVEIENTGDRKAEVSIYPASNGDVDYGNRLDLLHVSPSTTSCTWRYYVLPNNYDRILIVITKSTPNGGKVKGSVSVSQ